MIVIDLSRKEVQKILGLEHVPTTSWYSHTVDFSGTKFKVVSVDVFFDDRGEETRCRVELLPVVHMKSKEQLAAEDAVKKAEQSLEAAKKTLQQIKEGK